MATERFEAPYHVISPATPITELVDTSLDRALTRSHNEQRVADASRP